MKMFLCLFATVVIAGRVAAQDAPITVADSVAITSLLLEEAKNRVSHDGAVLVILDNERSAFRLSRSALSSLASRVDDFKLIDDVMVHFECSGSAVGSEAHLCPMISEGLLVGIERFRQSDADYIAEVGYTDSTGYSYFYAALRPDQASRRWSILSVW